MTRAEAMPWEWASTIPDAGRRGSRWPEEPLEPLIAAFARVDSPTDPIVPRSYVADAAIVEPSRPVDDAQLHAACVRFRDAMLRLEARPGDPVMGNAEGRWARLPDHRERGLSGRSALQPFTRDDHLAPSLRPFEQDVEQPETRVARRRSLIGPIRADVLRPGSSSGSRSRSSPAGSPRSQPSAGSPPAARRASPPPSAPPAGAAGSARSGRARRASRRRRAHDRGGRGRVGGRCRRRRTPGSSGPRRRAPRRLGALSRRGSRGIVLARVHSDRRRTSRHPMRRVTTSVRAAPQMHDGVRAPRTPALGVRERVGGCGGQPERFEAQPDAQVADREGVRVAEGAHRDVGRRPGADAGHRKQPLGGRLAIRRPGEIQLAGCDELGDPLQRGRASCREAEGPQGARGQLLGGREQMRDAVERSVDPRASRRRDAAGERSSRSDADLLPEDRTYGKLEPVGRTRDADAGRRSHERSERGIRRQRGVDHRRSASRSSRRLAIGMREDGCASSAGKRRITSSRSRRGVRAITVCAPSGVRTARRKAVPSNDSTPGIARSPKNRRSGSIAIGGRYRSRLRSRGSRLRAVRHQRTHARHRPLPDETDTGRSKHAVMSASVSTSWIGPEATRRPRRRSAACVAVLGISSTWWVTSMVVGDASAVEDNASSSSSRPGRSSPAAGSSSSRSCGRPNSARASNTRWRSPWLHVASGRPARSAHPTRSSRSSAPAIVRVERLHPRDERGALAGEHHVARREVPGDASAT